MAEKLTIRPATRADAAAWLSMRCALWPDGSEAEHRVEIDRYFQNQFAREPWAVLIAQGRDGQVWGFTELSVRPYAEGCHTRRVAYLEGWFVRAEARGRGVGRELVRASEEWGRAHSCHEFASDAEPDNHLSVSAHRAVGFVDAGTVLCFRKAL